MSGEDAYIKPAQGKGCTANRARTEGRGQGSSNGPVYDIVLASATFAICCMSICRGWPRLTATSHSSAAPPLLFSPLPPSPTSCTTTCQKLPNCLPHQKRK